MQTKLCKYIFNKLFNNIQHIYKKKETTTGSYIQKYD